MQVKKTEQLVRLKGHDIDVTLLEPSTTKGTILFLHGAGESSKDRLAPLAEVMATKGYKSLNFSLPGHGRSSGSLLGQTLQDREETTLAVAQHFGFWPVDTVVAVSMGGYTAMSLSQQGAFQRLVLMVPAIYAHEAQTVPFGPEFSAILRTPNSYKSSQAVQKLAAFKGEVAVVRAGRDEVIPPGVYDLIQDVRPRHHQVHLPDSGHQVTIYLTENPEQLAKMAHALDSFDFSQL